MYNIVETQKDFSTAVSDLETAVVKNGFGVLHIHNLGDTLRSKGIDFNENCKIFEVCNPIQAAKVLAVDMSMNMALPCRVSVYSEKGKVKIGYIRPVDMLTVLSNEAEIKQVASEVEESMIKIINDAK